MHLTLWCKVTVLMKSKKSVLVINCFAFIWRFYLILWIYVMTFKLFSIKNVFLANRRTSHGMKLQNVGPPLFSSCSSIEPPSTRIHKITSTHSKMFKGRTTKPCPTHVLNAFDAHDFITPIKSHLMYFISCSFTPGETFLWTSAVMEPTFASCPYFTWQFSGNGSDNHHVMNAAVWCHACLCMRLSNEARDGERDICAAMPADSHYQHNGPAWVTMSPLGYSWIMRCSCKWKHTRHTLLSLCVCTWACGHCSSYISPGIFASTDWG